MYKCMCALQKVFRLWFFRWNASTLLRCCFKYDEISVQVIVQLKYGGHITAPSFEGRAKLAGISILSVLNVST